jgi:hypothetical protein
MVGKKIGPASLSLDVACRIAFVGCVSLLATGSASAQTSCTLGPAELRPGCSPPTHLAEPQRTLAKNCSPDLSAGAGAEYCEGYQTIQTGSGGAEVIAYFTGTFKTTATDFVLRWVCPDPRLNVRLRLSLGNGFTFTPLNPDQLIRCSSQEFRVPARLGKQFTLDHFVYAVVELERSSCERPRFLNVTLDIPENLAQSKSPKGVLIDKYNGKRILIVSSNQVGSWKVEVKSRDAVLKRDSPYPNGGPLGNLVIDVPDTTQCDFLSVHADRGGRSEGDTWIASIQR